MYNLEKFIGNFQKSYGISWFYALYSLDCFMWFESFFGGGERMNKASEMPGSMEALQVSYYPEPRKIKLL
jgi:hypothetical protein